MSSLNISSRIIYFLFLQFIQCDLIAWLKAQWNYIKIRKFISPNEKLQGRGCRLETCPVMFLSNSAPGPRGRVRARVPVSQPARARAPEACVRDVPCNGSSACLVIYLFFLIKPKKYLAPNCLEND